MASRSSADATRFTATEPHAYSQPTSIRSSTASATSPNMQPALQAASKPVGPTSVRPNLTGPRPPEMESPKEKVARLRAARLAQRDKQLTTWERTVIRGRVWADRIHRFTALSLIGFSRMALYDSSLTDYIFFLSPGLLWPLIRLADVSLSNSYSSRRDNVRYHRYDPPQPT